MGISEEARLGERVAKLEQLTDGNASRIKRLETESEALIRLTTLVELQTDVNRENVQQMKDFSLVLNKINNNLTDLNHESMLTKDKVSEVSTRVQQIENTQQSYKIDVPKLITRILIGCAMIIPSLILAYLLIKFNWK